jgi:hypothetical protein
VDLDDFFDDWEAEPGAVLAGSVPGVDSRSRRSRWPLATFSGFRRSWLTMFANSARRSFWRRSVTSWYTWTDPLNDSS